MALVKEIVGARPELCGMSNLEGYRPLPLWILALSQSQEADMAWEVLEFLGKHTDMRVWQERAAVDKENAARLRQFTARFGSPAFGSGYKKEQMGKALGTPQKTKYRLYRI